MLYQWIISLPMMVCLFWCIFFAVRAFRGEDEPRVKYTILLFYFASTVLYVNHWLFFSNHETTIGTYTYLLANLCVYPLYYMYLRALTRTRYTWDNYALFVPAVLLTIFFPLNLYFPTRIFFAIQVVWVWICGFRLLRATRNRMDNTYTDDRSHILKPTHAMLILIGITAMVSMALNVLGRELFDGSLLVYIPAVLMSVLLFSLGYVAAHTTLPIETVSQEENHEEDKATTAETDELMFKIAAVLREDKLFANSNLTIQDLATAIGSNRTYVSQCINRRTGLSFSQYVARYRVEHAQQILRDSGYGTDKEAIMDAMTSSGFSSDQTFYRVFKEITGETPLQYRHNNLQ